MRESISKLTITDIDSIEFRRSYVNFEQLSDAEAEELRNTNPVLIEQISNELSGRLNELGLMRADSLVLSKFQVVDSFRLESKRGEIVTIHTKYEKDHASYAIGINAGPTVSEIILTNNIGTVKFATADIVPGGFEEILVLRNYYVMNGDNYFIHIYEVFR